MESTTTCSFVTLMSADGEKKEEEISTSEIKSFDLKEMMKVIDNAVEAYTRSTASMRGSRSRIAKMYKSHGKGKVRYTGPSADDILEDYLTSHGLKRCSSMWVDLSRIIIEKAERGKIEEETRLAYFCRVNKVPFHL